MDLTVERLRSQGRSLALLCYIIYLFLSDVFPLICSVNQHRFAPHGKKDWSSRKSLRPSHETMGLSSGIIYGLSNYFLQIVVLCFARGYFGASVNVYRNLSAVFRTGPLPLTFTIVSAVDIFSIKSLTTMNILIFILSCRLQLLI